MTDQETGPTEPAVAPDAQRGTDPPEGSAATDDPSPARTATESTDQTTGEQTGEPTSEQATEETGGSAGEQPAEQAAPQAAEQPAEKTNDAPVVGTADIAVTGLATMGRNLARNLARHGYHVAVHNRTEARTEALLSTFGSEGEFTGCKTLADLATALKRPRTVIVMVQAGAPTDAVVDELADVLEPGDIVVDGGNAHYLDTRRRETALAAKGIQFVGAGISGGEEGALEGPSIMPGGSAEAYATVGPIFESIAAQVDGTPCCTHVGPDGAGHFVKMVHNGIEYADMQLIAEAYDLLRTLLGPSPSQLAEIFETWNAGDLESFLIEITAKVLATRDPRTGGWFIDVIRDEAEQKGTGRWTVQAALDLGSPVSGIAEAVFARALSGSGMQRMVARDTLAGAQIPPTIADPDQFIEDVRQALYASKVVAYAQGFDMLRAASEAYNWDLDPGALATIWRGGCIIRARFLDRIADAFTAPAPADDGGGASGSGAITGADSNGPVTLLVDRYFADAVAKAQASWRRVVATAAAAGVPAPGFAAALAHYDGLRRDRSPAALIQGLRDLFGAHTYRRIDTPGVFHLDWSGDDPDARVEYEVG